MKNDKLEIWVVYCYYPLFAKLPRRKWVKFSSKQKAREFIQAQVLGKKDRFIWEILVNNEVVESL